MSVPMIHNLISSMNRMNDDMVAYPFGHDFGYGLHPMSVLAAAPAVPSAHHRSLVRHADHPGHVAKQHGPVTTIGKDGFQVCMDVTQFKPNELQVKMVYNHIVVEGRHEQREDDHGYIMRHFTRLYSLPKGYDADRVVHSLRTKRRVVSYTFSKPVRLILTSKPIPMRRTIKRPATAPMATLLKRSNAAFKMEFFIIHKTLYLLKTHSIYFQYYFLYSI